MWDADAIDAGMVELSEQEFGSVEGFEGASVCKVERAVSNSAMVSSRGGCQR